MFRGIRRGLDRAPRALRPKLAPSVRIFHESLESRVLLSGALDTSFSGDGKATVDLGGSDSAAAVLVQPDGKIVTAGSRNDLVALARFTATGSLDPTFSSDGKVLFSQGGNDLIMCAALQGDGKIIVAGRVTPVGSSSGDMIVLRVNGSDGSLDSTFGTGGFSKIDVGGDDTASAVAIQPDGKIVLAGSSSDAFTTSCSVVRLNTDGSRDTGFGTNGQFDFGHDLHTSLNAMTLQPDGKIVVAGTTDNNSGVFDFIVFRVLANGGIDRSFNQTGLTVLDMGGADDNATGVALQANGKIVVGGSSNLQFAVARLTADGTPDSAFSGDGKLSINLGVGFGSALVVRPDRKIVIAGSVGALGNRNIGLAQINPDGNLDTAFDGDGKLVTDFGGDDSANALALQTDGKLVAAGGSNTDFAVARYADPLPPGSLDPTWNGKGVAFNDASVNDIAVQADGKVVVSDFGLLAARFNADGSQDLGFNTGAFSQTPLRATNAIALTSEGKILICGEGHGQFFGFAIVRLNQDGTLDKSFGTGGTTVISFNTDTSASAMAVLADGRIVLTGTLNGGGAAVARLTAGGLPDTSFSGDGKLTLPGTTIGRGDSVLVQPDQKIVIAGDTQVVRLNSNGSLDTSFSGDGIQTIPLGINGEVLRVARQRDGKLVLGGDDGIGFANDLFVARLNANGSPDTSFNRTGKVTLDAGGNELAGALVLQPDGKIVIGGKTASLLNGNEDALIARINTNGTLDTSFGNRGFAVTDLGDQEQIGALAIQSDGKILGAGNLEVFRYLGDSTRVAITGSVFLDSNHDAKRQAAEAGLFRFQVFIDANNDGALDNGEISTLSDDHGNYAFNNLAPGTYTVRVISSSGFTASTANGSAKAITVNSGASANNNFGQTINNATASPDIHVTPTAVIEGALVSLQGHLTDPNAGDALTLKVDWGDGTTQTLHPGLAPFNFPHRYALAGPGGQYMIHATWFDQIGAGNSRDLFVAVTNAPLDEASTLKRFADVNVAFANAFLGSFRDQNALNTNPASFVGTINWGDGLTSAASFVFDGAALDHGSYWSVNGSHKYTKKGTYSVSVTIHDSASPTVNLIVPATIMVV